LCGMGNMHDEQAIAITVKLAWGKYFISWRT
jgi:hypothetical protein